MNKTVEALLRGYIFFRVSGGMVRFIETDRGTIILPHFTSNTKYFFRYNSALAEQKSITGNVSFDGWNIFHYLFSRYGAWRGFYYRVDFNS